jgi:hypothetical protein
VDRQPLVHVAAEQPLALLHHDRRGGGEALAVDVVAADRAVAHDHRVLEVDLRLVGRVLGLDDERAQQPLRHLLGRVVVRVVHVGAGVPLTDPELVGEGLARLDRVLGDERDAVHADRHAQAVPVDRRALVRHLVRDEDAHRVALGDPDLGARHDAVVGVGLEELAGAVLPLDDPGT